MNGKLKAGPDLWRQTAASILPPRHPARETVEVKDIRSALNSFAASQTDLRNGQVQCQLHIPRVLGTPIFAPNGRDFAAMVVVYEDPAMRLCMESTFCLTVFLEDGTKADVARGPVADSPNYMDWAWSADGESLVHLELFQSRGGGDEPTCHHAS
ncbi:hypothetical protein WJX73_001413 [Symbiochloris irregularis]|uniref:Uncharacterized protein n=1 Tax=Symbiochloris irregularis TaxID=706552 RepID=A0AAW1PRN0_9CHLO